MDKGGWVCIVHGCYPYVLSVISLVTYGSCTHE